MYTCGIFLRAVTHQREIRRKNLGPSTTFDLRVMNFYTGYHMLRTATTSHNAYAYAYPNKHLFRLNTYIPHPLSPALLLLYPSACFTFAECQRNTGGHVGLSPLGRVGHTPGIHRRRPNAGCRGGLICLTGTSPVRGCRIRSTRAQYNSRCRAARHASTVG